MTTYRNSGYGFRYSSNSWQVGQNIDMFQHQILSPKIGGGRGGSSGGIGSWPSLTKEEMLPWEPEEVSLKEVISPVIRKGQRLKNSKLSYQGQRKAGPFSQLDKKAMILNRKRRLRLTTERKGGYTEHDLRFRLWHEEPSIQDRLILLALMDTSGSMEEEAKQIARMFFWRLLAVMGEIYHQVEPIFISHQTEAEEVSKRHFFSKGSWGGTKFSSAYRLAWEIITTRYERDKHPVAVFHLSDGANIPNDRRESHNWLLKLCQVCQLFCYGEVGGKNHSLQTYLDIVKDWSHPALVLLRMEEKTHISQALNTLLSKVVTRLERD